MNAAIDSLKSMLAYRKRDLDRTQDSIDELGRRIVEVNILRTEQLKEIEDLKDAIDTLEKNNA